MSKPPPMKRIAAYYSDKKSSTTAMRLGLVQEYGNSGPLKFSHITTNIAGNPLFSEEAVGKSAFIQPGKRPHFVVDHGGLCGKLYTGVDDTDKEQQFRVLFPEYEEGVVGQKPNSYIVVPESVRSKLKLDTYQKVVGLLGTNAATFAMSERVEDIDCTTDDIVTRDLLASIGVGKAAPVTGIEAFEYEGVGLAELSQMFAATFTEESADSVQSIHDDMIKKKAVLISTLQQEMPDIDEVQSQHDKYVVAEAEYKMQKRTRENKNATLEIKRSKLLKRINQVMGEEEADCID